MVLGSSFSCTGWAPAIYKWSSNPFKYSFSPSYSFIRPFIGVMTLLITIVGPTLYHLAGVAEP